MLAGNRPNHPETAASSWPGRIHRTSTVCRPSMTEFPGSPVRGCSDTLDRFEASGPDRLDELLVVPVVLVGVACGEVGDRPVECVVGAQVLGHRDRVAGPGMGPR